MKPIAQAVVTDPGGGSHGYVLVASSPGLKPADAEFLERSPGVSEYLHTAKKPRPCFSFYPLPSGAWALSRRFVSGQRRGEYNRVVAHTLVFHDDLLTALAVEPSLLTSRCLYRSARHPSGPAVEFFELSKIAADPDLDDLPDLLCQLPSDLARASSELSTQRRKYLLRTSSESELESHLCAIFAALEKDESVLLPQEPAFEELLRLAWSALPPADRRQIAWTTHLAPGTRVTFRMVNAPGRHGHGEWWIFEESAKRTDHELSDGAKMLARVVAQDEPPLAAHFAQLGEWSHRVSLLKREGSLTRWLHWITLWSRQIEKGCGSVEELEHFYAAVGGQDSEIDPWIQTSSIVHCTFHTLKKLVLAANREEAIAAVDRALFRSGFHSQVLDPSNLAALSQGTFGELEALALDVALRDLGRRLPPPRGKSEREALFDVLVAKRDIDWSETTGDVLLVSALELEDCGSAVGRRILEHMAHEAPAFLGSAPEKLATLERSPLPAAERLVSVLHGSRGSWGPHLDVLLSHVLIPQLQDRRMLEGVFDPALLRFALTQAEAGTLAQALQGWKGQPLELVVHILRQWIKELPEEALKTAERLELEAVIEPETFLAGLSVELRRIGAKATQWMPIAIAEATRLDRDAGAKELAERLFMPLNETGLSDEEADRCFPAVLEALERNAAFVGPCHLLLFRSTAPATARRADETIRAFKSFLPKVRQGRGSRFVPYEWASAIQDAVESLKKSRLEAKVSLLIAEYWRALARVDQIPPPEVIAMLDDLQKAEHRLVARAWKLRFESLAKSEAGRPLADRLARMVPGDRKLEAARLEADIHSASETLIADLNHHHDLVGGDPGVLSEILGQRVLPRAEPERSFLVLKLLCSPKPLWPAIYEALEKNYLVSAVAEVLDRDPDWLKNVERLTAREALLIRVAKSLGLKARRNSSEATAFLEWSLSSSWSPEPDAQRDLFVATLLRSSEVARERLWDLIEDLYENRRADLLEQLLTLASGSAQPYLRDKVKILEGKLAMLFGSYAGVLE